MFGKLTEKRLNDLEKNMKDLISSNDDKINRIQNQIVMMTETIQHIKDMLSTIIKEKQ